MQISIDFLQAIGHTVRVYIRCIVPKNTPMPELESLGMTHKDKSGQVKKSTINGYIDLSNGEFHRRQGKDYKLIIDGWGHLKDLNKQGYGVYFVVAHGGDKNVDIIHATTLFHESDLASLEQQQLEIDKITQNFGKPTAVVQTKKSLHGYWASEIIRIDDLSTYQKRWLEYSNCDDLSLADPAQLMRLPGFDHLTWNGTNFDRVECKLLQLNKVSYSLEQFDQVLPALNIARWCKKSVIELNESDPDDRDIRSLAPYLQGYDSSGKWIKAKCPAHNGESSDSLHIDSNTSGFICHAGCKSSAVYNAAKAIAVAAGHRFEVVSVDEYFKESINKALDLKNCEAPILFGGNLGSLLNRTAKNFNERVEIFNFILIPVLASRIPAETSLLVNAGSGFVVKPIRWCCLVGSTGTMKSPIINTAIKPLNAQQKEIWVKYQSDLESYNDLSREYERLGKEEKKAADEPLAPKPMQSVYFSDFTIEALISAISEYPDQGTIIYSDELAGFFSSMDAYKSSAGVDRPKWLSIWDGGAIKSTRRTGSSYVPYSSISIIGSIQPGIIESMIKKDKSKADGLWPRFTFMRIQHNITDLFNEIDGSLDKTLREIYERLGNDPPQQHTIDVNARSLCTAWHEFLQQKMRDEGDNNPLMVGVYAKTIGITFRNALIFHRVYAAISETISTQTIPLSTIKTAIAWTKFELNQTLLEYQMLGLTDDNDPELARIIKFISKFGRDDWLCSNPDGWVSARDVIHWWSPKPKPTSANVRKFMNKVVALGHAASNDEASDSPKFKIKIITQKCGDSGNKTAEPQYQRHSPLLDDMVTEISQGIVDPVPFIGSDVVVTENGVSGNTANNSNEKPEDIRDFVTTDYQADLKNGNKVKDDCGKGSGKTVTTVTILSENNLKIGDRVNLGEDIITNEKLENDVVCDRSDKCEYISGSINDLSADIPIETKEVSILPIQYGYKIVSSGDGSIEIVCDSGNKSETTEPHIEIDENGIITQW